MKIYFSGSIRGGREDAALYHKLIEELKRYGEVLTEHVGEPGSAASDSLTDSEIHNRDMEWLEAAEIVIAEVTTPSLGVGYEIGRAIHLNKTIYCLYREKGRKNVSAMIKGSPDLQCYKYKNLADAKEILRNIFRV